MAASIGENEKRLLEIISRGHPSRTMKVKRQGRAIKVSALTWDEMQSAFNSPSSVIHECIARLVANDYIDSERSYSTLWEAIKSGETPTHYWITQKGWTFLEREAAKAPPPSNDKSDVTQADLDKVEAFAKYLGYDLTRYGIGVALLSLESGYSPLETASHLALVTLARDAREAGTDIMKLMALVPHAREMIRALTEYQRDNPSLMREELFKNDAVAILKVVMVDKDQPAWIERVLRDPTTASERIAISRIDYRKLMR